MGNGFKMQSSSSPSVPCRQKIQSIRMQTKHKHPIIMEIYAHEMDFMEAEDWGLYFLLFPQSLTLLWDCEQLITALLVLRGILAREHQELKSPTTTELVVSAGPVSIIITPPCIHGLPQEPSHYFHFTTSIYKLPVNLSVDFWIWFYVYQHRIFQIDSLFNLKPI